MASFQYYTRRARRLISSPIFQAFSICLLLFFGVRWVIDHNHDADEEAMLQVSVPMFTGEDEKRDWSRFAYVQYVTTPEDLCNVVMIWSEFEDIGTRAQRMMLYPSNWNLGEVNQTDPAHGLTRIARLLQTAQEDYHVTLQPVDDLLHDINSSPRWTDSYTKFLAFNLTQFSRILVIDSDSAVLQNLDAIFLIPSAPAAMPYVYWGQPTGFALSSHLLLLEPSKETFNGILEAIEAAPPNSYDLDILNTVFNHRILRIPQRPYNLLSGEFRRATHDAYLSSQITKWDPDAIIREAKFIHFSDWPVPKIWTKPGKDVLYKYMPKCAKSEWFGASDCRNREIWLGFYSGFAKGRKAVCGAGFESKDKISSPESNSRDGRWFHPDEVV